MRGLAIRLTIVLAALLVVSQFVLPPVLEHVVANRLTDHGGTAKVHLSAIPAAELLFSHGDSLSIKATGLSIPLDRQQADLLDRLDNFGSVDINLSRSKLGPFSVQRFTLHRVGPQLYAVRVNANGAPADVARYAGAQLGGGFGGTLAGLAAGFLGGLDKPVPMVASMNLDTTTSPPAARDVVGDVAGLPAGPFAGIVTNAILTSL